MAQKTNPKPDAKAVKPKKGAKPAPKATRPEAATPPLASQPAPPSAAAATTTTTKAAQEAKPKKLSALDAAAKVLAESGEAMTTQALIQAMAAKGYWTSPGGKTPHATLYAAILREITAKGKDARFKKSARGKFALAG